MHRLPPTLYFAPPSVTAAVVVDQQDVGDYTQYIVDVNSIGTGNTLTVEATLDGTTWRVLPFLDLGSSNGSPTTSRTSTGIIGLDVSGFKTVRSRVSTYGSGTVTVKTAMTYSPYALDQAVAGISGGTISAIPAAPTATQGVGSLAKVKAAASTNLTAVKTSAGRIIGGILHNTTAAAIFLKFYDTASPVVGTTVPTFTLRIPANGELRLIDLMALPFGTAIRYALTTGVAETDATAVAVDSVVGFIQFV